MELSFQCLFNQRALHQVPVDRVVGRPDPVAEV